MSAVGYEPDTGVLEIEFRSGAVYRYFLVPSSVVEELVTSPSKGTFFVERIKGAFASERVA